MNQTDVMNAIQAAELEGLKRAKEKYPNMEIPVFQNIASSTNDCQALSPQTQAMHTDIWGTNPSNNKYPLRKAPSSDLRNMNFSEWQDLCGNVSPQNRIDIDPETAVTAAAGIGWALLGISNPIASAVAGVANVLIPILWPTAAEDPNVIWNSLMAKAEALVDAKIDQAMKALAISKINGLKNAMNEYCRALARLKADPNNPTEKAVVRGAYQSMDFLFLYSMPQFAVPNFEVQLLPTYAEAANLHLLFIRDAVKFGNSWDMTQAQIEGEYTDLRNHTREYTTHCVNWFNTGLTRLETKSANMTDCKRYPWATYYQYGWECALSPRTCPTIPLTSTCDEQTNEYYPEEKPETRGTGYRGSEGEYQGLENWNLYNDFRRDMTILVLDIVSVWPTYDPRLYQLGVKSELTRTLYTPIRGTTYRSDLNQNTRSAIENRMIPQPGLFTWLTQLKFERINIPYNGTTYGSQYTAGDLLTGGSQQRKYTLSSLSFENQFGQTGTLPIITVNSTPDSSITKLITRQWFEPREIELYKGNASQFTLGSIVERCPYLMGESGYTKQVIYDPTRRDNMIPKAMDPNNPSAPASQWKDSHRLSYFKYEPLRANSPFGYPDRGQIGAVLFGWTHMLVDPNNTISSDQITRIPAVKGYNRSTDASIIEGPGCTGGNVASLRSRVTPEGSIFQGVILIRVTGVTAKAYRVRIRYAASQSITLIFERYRSSTGAAEFSRQETLSPTYSGTLTCNSFGYHTINSLLPATDFTLWELQIKNRTNANTTIIIDKIEFIPINTTLEEYEANQKLEKARKVVNALLSDDAKQRLKGTILGSDLDIAMGLIEDIPSDRFQKETMILRDRIKQAKRLSQSRNLLHYGDFESPDWSGENGWTISNDVSVESTNSILQGKYLNLPSARDPLSDGTVYPTYVYQKVDESKLKPYTRYWIRGLIGSSQDLELIVSRYRKEVHKTLNVPDNQDLTSLQNRFESLSGPEILEQVRENLQGISCGPYSSLVQTTDNNGEHPHLFSCYIDVGDLDLDNNPGISVAFKINSVDGGAQIRHIELVEGATLTSEEIARLKRQEKKWKQKKEQMCARDQEAIRAAQAAVERLFVSPTCGRLKLETKLQDIVYAQTLVNAIPDRYNPILSELPGVNMDIFNQLQNQLEM
ncbi:insecticidal delta-endotoxin Cry8Ea1 family protein, partial [Bacillus pacificus]|nr:insecticidal delta-endotoxin Cry8Ea1 family protein [Bacillus pacificus]